MLNLQSSRPLRTLPWVLLAALVPACHHGSSSSGSGGPGGGTPLTIDNLVVEPGPNFAKVTWETNLASDSRVEFGLTPNYTEAVSDDGQTLIHTMVLTGLTPNSEYHLNAISSTLSGLTAETGDTVFNTVQPAGFLSEDFNRFNLNRSVWDYVDPHSRGELKMQGAGSGEARAVISVPDISIANYSPSNGALRLSQTMRDIDPGRYEAKFLNRWENVDGTGGVFVEASPGNFAHFGFRYDGTDLLLEGKEYQGGNLVSTQSTFVQSGPWTDNAPLYMRVNRAGNTYSSRFSFDGTNYNFGPDANLNGAPTKGGLWASNGPGTTGQFNLVTDYLFDRAFPLPLEDVGTPDDNDEPYIYRYDVMALSDATARVRWWSDEATSGVLRYGLTSDLVGGVKFSGEPDWVNSILVGALDPGSVYMMELAAGDLRGQETVLSGLTVTTPAVGGGNPTIRVWNGWDHPTLQLNFQSFGTFGNPQDRVNIVGRVLDADEDRLALVETLRYSLNGGPFEVTPLGDRRYLNSENPWRLTKEGDFNVVLPVSSLLAAPIVDGYHRNELRLEVTDDDGNLGIRTVFVLYKPGTIWARNFMTDFMDAAFADKSGPQNAVQIIDGEWYIDQTTLGFAIRTAPKQLGYDRLFAIGEALNQPWDNYEATIPFTVMGFDLDGFTPGTGSYAFGIVNRWNGHQAGGPFEMPKHGVYPLSSLWTYRWFDQSGGNENWQVWVNQNNEVKNLNGPGVTLGDDYMIRARVQTQGGGSTLHQFKVWRIQDGEPANWTFEETTPAGEGPNTGSLAIFAHHVDLVVGDITVNGL